MHPGRRSTTSTWDSAIRALYTQAPAAYALLDDPAALPLLPLKWGATLRVLGALPLGTRAAHRVLGLVSQGLSYDVALRTAAVDDVVRRASEAGIEQLVLLGAGLDTRAWRIPELERSMVYELDYPSTQAYKRPRIEALTPLSSGVQFCPIDFERQAIGRALDAAGFQRQERSVWVSESVTPFLSRPAVDAMIDAMAACAAPGSLVALTYVPPHYARRLVRGFAEKLASAIDEPVKTTLDSAELASSLSRHGFAVESDESAPEWARRYWPEKLRARVRSWERLVVARRRAE